MKGVYEDAAEAISIGKRRTTRVSLASLTYILEVKISNLTSTKKIFSEKQKKKGLAQNLHLSQPLINNYSSDGIVITIPGTISVIT